ncbi:AIF_collapsed_G0031550.mRNA.1.CDS.1 [Saccharomyces cerevisiae]|nr:AIF_collapsed_G0031550.mRNA.1.CDS.1 [Saccharomyces cerevisiae]
MCHKWAQGASPYNPAGINVTIVEMKHQPDRFDIRGGAKSAEHVDILGSAELNDYILKIASGNGDLVEPRQLSNLSQWVSPDALPNVNDRH